jgi:hypothetical protein
MTIDMWASVFHEPNSATPDPGLRTPDSKYLYLLRDRR